MKTIAKVGGQNTTFYAQLRGLSSDIKPTEDIPNGSEFLEMDTSYLFRYDEQNKQWLMVENNSSGGGGSGGEGTKDYNKLVNLPQINNVTLKGNIPLGTLGVSVVGVTNDYSSLDNIPKPITKVSELINDSGFVANNTQDLVNYYTKLQTFNKDEVLQMVALASGIQLLVVPQLPEFNMKDNIIYLVPASDNVYEQWVYSEDKWYKLGTTDVNLMNYYDKTEANNTFVQKETNKVLSSNDYTNVDKNKLNSIEYGANYYSLPVATTTTLGGVKIDGNTITINADGAITANVNSGGEAVKDYTQLENKPKINGVELVGDKSAEALGLATKTYVEEQINTSIFTVLGGAY